MTTRDPARRPLCQAAAALLCAATALTASIPGCYSEATGTSPPTNTFYFPVGLAVSPAGNVLYVANSDFDLQWNGGTLQSYNLFQIRQDTAELINANFGRSVGFINPILYSLPASTFRNVGGPPGPTDNSFGRIKGYPATAGWNACTGLGSVNGTSLQNGVKAALAAQQQPVSVGR